LDACRFAQRPSPPPPPLPPSSLTHPFAQTPSHSPPGRPKDPTRRCATRPPPHFCYTDAPPTVRGVNATAVGPRGCTPTPDATVALLAAMRTASPEVLLRRESVTPAAGITPPPDERRLPPGVDARLLPRLVVSVTTRVGFICHLCGLVMSMPLSSCTWLALCSGPRRTRHRQQYGTARQPHHTATPTPTAPPTTTTAAIAMPAAAGADSVADETTLDGSEPLPAGSMDGVAVAAAGLLAAVELQVALLDTDGDDPVDAVPVPLRVAVALAVDEGDDVAVRELDCEAPVDKDAVGVTVLDTVAVAEAVLLPVPDADDDRVLDAELVGVVVGNAVAEPVLDGVGELVTLGVGVADGASGTKHDPLNSE
jgi:hypothetical protein